MQDDQAHKTEFYIAKKNKGATYLYIFVKQPLQESSLAVPPVAVPIGTTGL